MDWNMVGAIGEVGGAIGVIVTLIYLAGQLKQNTNALRSASYEHWNTQVAQYGHYQGQHAKELAEMRKADSHGELTPEQLNYLAGEASIVMSQGECAFLKYRAGALDDDVYEIRIQAVADYLESNKLARQGWLDFASRNYVPAYVEMLSERL